MDWRVAVSIIVAWGSSLVVLATALSRLFKELQAVNVKLAVMDERLNNHIKTEEEDRADGDSKSA